MPSADFLRFEEARPMLLGLAYRILGSRADAEDAVQDTFLKWQAADREAIDTPHAWLTTACTRRCLDLLGNAHRARVDYVGAWLPEPIPTTAVSDAERSMQLADSLSTAFLLLLERLSPKERVAYLLHEIFDTPYAEIATMLELKEPACRKLVSRARANLLAAEQRHAPPRERQQALLEAFRLAITEGTTARLANLLSAEVRLSAELDFLASRLSQYWADYLWRVADINGGPGFMMYREGSVVATVTFGYDRSGQATDIFIVRNPDKLTRLRS
ncbi:sigma-70 family RNA polymerase sigma factor [Billgrantia aerodenitrificans]|uniref:Sigma-70 family RNA polymerase sigma factor n=1 Tax=Billgrantia aerodenitrificans TaxID=2733483 RepID=A0ABS9AMA8_9GAMM|nr:sigma-70 family RNA polymerase sigma factor [Halomonas aerodenitrificans]MCE8022899.1 sigma-70 family RNA polymerase sigma factor [Halomonas aerodenitrificans]